MSHATSTQESSSPQANKTRAARFFLSLPSINIFSKTASDTVPTKPELLQASQYNEVFSGIDGSRETALLADRNAAKPRIIEPVAIVPRGNTPCETLMAACRDGDLITLDLLVRQGVNLDYKDENFNTALCIAAQFGHTNCVSVLCKHVRTLNQRGHFKQTPIYFAAANGHLDVVQLLAMKGARLNIKNSTGSHCLTCLSPDFINQLRFSIQQALNHLDGNLDHTALCKRFRSSLRAIDQYCEK